MQIGKIDELIALLNGSHSSELLVRKGQESVHIVRGAKRKKQAGRAVVRHAESGPHSSQADDTILIISPKVGIFHSADGIEPGSTVRLGQPLGVIESMKIHNEILSEVAGVIVDMAVENGSPVEYGQELYRIQQS